MIISEKREGGKEGGGNQPFRYAGNKANDFREGTKAFDISRNE